jgi:hypothetical protein
MTGMHEPGFDPMTAVRTRPAYLAILHELADDQWHSVQDLQYTAEQASDLAPTTVDHLIRWGYRRGPGFRPWRKTGKSKERLIQRTGS